MSENMKDYEYQNDLPRPQKPKKPKPNERLGDAIVTGLYRDIPDAVYDMLNKAVMTDEWWFSNEVLAKGLTWKTRHSPLQYWLKDLDKDCDDLIRDSTEKVFPKGIFIPLQNAKALKNQLGRAYNERFKRIPEQIFDQIDAAKNMGENIPDVY
jgi:hypothetical protein